VLQSVTEERENLHTMKRTKANWICHILRRKSLIKHVIEGRKEGRVEVMRRRERRRKQLLDYLKEMGCYCKLKEENVGVKHGRSH